MVIVLPFFFPILIFTQFPFSTSIEERFYPPFLPPDFNVHYYDYEKGNTAELFRLRINFCSITGVPYFSQTNFDQSMNIGYALFLLQG